MMAITHMAVSLAGATIITGSADPKVLLLASIGSQIPDLDTTKSWVGLAFYPLARFLEERFPHRSITHSFFTTLAIREASPFGLSHFSQSQFLYILIGNFGLLYQLDTY